MKRPELQDYGISTKQYKLYRNEEEFSGKTQFFIGVVIFLMVVLVAFIITRDWSATVFAGIVTLFPGIVGLIFATVLVECAFSQCRRFLLLRSNVASKIELYQRANAAFRTMRHETERKLKHESKVKLTKEEEERRISLAIQQRARQKAFEASRRKSTKHWAKMSGRRFEEELAVLYEQLGYQVESTPTSGDEGVDLILWKNGKKTVVQCKAHKDPVGPAIVRELYGAMHHFGADGAILACTGGFTPGVTEFAEGKPIELIALDEIVEMANEIVGVANWHDIKRVSEGRGHIQERFRCPQCGIRAMRLVYGQHAPFWQCRGYPNKCTRTKRA